jgi:3-hydroxyisobutyrate dehydrogenase
MLAGDRRGIEELRPVLTHLCQETVTTGAVPSAMACKISVNLYLIASVAALAEATALASKLGLQMAVFARVIGQGPLGSDVARAKLPKMISRDFAPEASILDVCKNAGLVADTAASARIDAEVLGSARRIFDGLLHAGSAKLDMAAVITAWDEETSNDE